MVDLGGVERGIGAGETIQAHEKAARAGGIKAIRFDQFMCRHHSKSVADLVYFRVHG